MKKVIIFLALSFLIFETGAASKKDDNRMKAAEQALSSGKYAEAKATFEDLKGDPQYRQKCYLYLAMIYHENGQVENALASLTDFKRYITDNTDVSLLKSAEILDDGLAKNYAALEIAIFDQGDRPGVDPGFYNLIFRAEEGMNPPQEARLKYINKVLSQSQGLMGWKSDGTFLKGRIMNFPIRMYDTSPMIAEINGVPVYFRFDFQTRQGLWIPGEILSGREQTAEPSIYTETSEMPITPAPPAERSSSKLFLIGAAAAIVAGLAVALSQ
jgi:tetratricopeptide (TPR) repeat protein